MYAIGMIRDIQDHSWSFCTLQASTRAVVVGVMQLVEELEYNLLFPTCIDLGSLLRIIWD
jgi:hypothetical protein